MKKYYIGLKSNNAICNEKYFDGSITLYPTGEKGNIFYSNETINDTNSDEFKRKYKKYIMEEVSKLNNSKFVIFNKNILELCDFLNKEKIIFNKNYNLVEFLNNKYEVRNYLKDIVPVLDYIWLEEKYNYEYLKNKIKSNQFVIQGVNGSGGENTYLISSENDYNELCLDGKYCISKYIKNIPLNITIIIGKKDIILLPISAQLISLEDLKFKYVGGDFSFVESLSNEIIDKIEKYSLSISNRLQNDGYLGILGIDYLLLENNDIVFMEINPRFQSSSFLINLFLSDKFNTCLAELHCLALENKKLPSINLNVINYSFLNCDKSKNYNEFNNYELIKNGYSNNINGVIYRKIYNYSLLKNKKNEFFEH